MKTIDLNLPASPASSASSGSDAADRTGNATHAESSTAAQTRRAGGPLAALADLHEARPGAIRRTLSGSGQADGSERPAKRLRRTLSDGSTPVAPWRNEPAMHVFRWSMMRRQPMARFLRSGPVADIANHLPHESQRSLFDALLCTPDERYGYLKLMRPEAAGRYLLQADDRAALNHALSQTGIETLHGVPLPDVVVDRAGWLLRAGTAAAAKAEAPVPQHALDAMERAEALLLGGFEQAGPSARAGAVRNLIETGASANTLDDALRFTLRALAPQRFRALPLNERAHALGRLALSVSDAAFIAWQGVDELSDDDDQAEREADLQTLLGDGLADIIPMMLDEARRLSPIPSDAARLLVTSLITTLECMPPDVGTQRAILDLFETLVPYLEGTDQDTTLARLAESLGLFGQSNEQRRMLNMVEHRHRGAAPAEDRLAHVGADGRSRILLGIVNSLHSIEDDGLRRESLSLLANQLAPDRARALPVYRLQQLLIKMMERDPGAHGAERMLTIALDALDVLPGLHLLGPLEAMVRREAGPLDDALAERMREARLRLAPRLPLTFMPAEAPLLDALSPENEARVMAARMNAAGGAAPHERQATFAMVAQRLAARAAGPADNWQVIRRMARALSPDAAAALADQLDAHLREALDLRLAPGPTIEYGRLLEMIDALHAQHR